MSHKPIDPLHIGVLGTGTMGTAIARLALKHHHDVMIASRNPARAVDQARKLGASSASDYREAAEWGDLVFYCVDWQNRQPALDPLEPLEGCILVDCSNPETPDGRRLEVGHTTSGAEEIAAQTGARVVKAFNHIYAELLDEQPAFEGATPSVFLCGDDDDAKRQVAAFIESCSFAPVDCGPLRNARYLEPLALLMVQLVRAQGWGPAQIALKLLIQSDNDRK